MNKGQNQEKKETKKMLRKETKKHERNSQTKKDETKDNQLKKQETKENHGKKQRSNGKTMKETKKLRIKKLKIGRNQRKK